MDSNGDENGAMVKLERGALWGWGLVVLVAAVLAGAGVWHGLLHGTPHTPATPSTEGPPVAARAPDTPPLPSSAQMDALLRSRLAGASSRSEFGAWLREPDLLRRVVAVVANMASGESPRSVVAFLAPRGDFRVRTHDGRSVISKGTYTRYDTLGLVVASLDSTLLVDTYREVRKLAEQLHQESAPPGSSFDSTLERAFAQVLAVPVLDGEVEVMPRGALYVYADPALEALTPAQKHLLRMGPANLRHIQGKVREISLKLNQQAARP
ncbi:hypothetical protein MYSTI_05042 [Myxococcus stipitatus DSM 14675]|uniref:DUF3014 domain-containing protein n=1 Tax=Myxococcus stipitatus (strain DSM 14675 / JCM 12634 / Mx s8) TaxID=1278073 RepID=L7UEN2_MYXSD|nr:DUF3014 domain-containing protein [Myxococcus stipitatus]AGC46330.1 hypothetical protein MYSTI_05042 [Myxococcus stipitatus DSM 14675]